MGTTRSDLNQHFRDGKLISEVAVQVDVTYEKLRERASAAFVSNSVYLALPAYPASPTAVQRDAAIRAIRQQVDALTRQANALIRLQLNELDDTTDT